MRNFTDSEKALWLSDYSQKTYTVVIDGEEYDEDYLNTESLQITEILEDGEQLNFIGCKSRKLEINILDTETEFVNKSIVIKAKASLGDDETSEAVLFRGVIAEVKQKSQADIMVTVTAYDHMATVIQMDVAPWYNALTFPMTLAQFRKALPNSMNVKDEVLPFDDVTLEKTIEPDILPAKDVLGAIASLNGMYCTCNTDGQIAFMAVKKYVSTSVHPADDLFPADNLYPNNPSTNAEHIPETEYLKAEYEDYIVETIDKVQIRSEENDIGAIYGTGSNAYILQGNFLLYGKGTTELTSIAQRLLSLVEGILYSPAKIECKGRPWIEVGDLVRIYTQTKTVYSYVLQRVWKGMHFVSDTYSSNQSATRNEQVNTVNTQIIQLRGKANKLTRDIEHLSSEIYNEDGSSKIEQTAEAVSACVQQRGGSQSFSWQLLADGFSLKCGNVEVFRCDKNGITVNGYATATRMSAAETNIQNLYANEATLGNLIATKASIDSFNSTNAKVDNLSGRVASLDTIVAGKLTTTQLSANISALDKVNCNQLSVGKKDAGEQKIYYKDHNNNNRTITVLALQ